MFSQLFRKKQFDLLAPYSREPNMKVVRLVKSVLYAIRSTKEEAKRCARWDREELLQFYNSARQLLQQLEDVETAVAQKVAYRAYQSILLLHECARNGLKINRSASWHVASNNDLPVGSLLQFSEYPSKYDMDREDDEVIFRYSDGLILPEYIFVERMIHSAVDAQGAKAGHRVHVLAFTRVFLELLVTSSRLIHLYESSNEIDRGLVKKMISSKEALHLLLTPQLEVHQIVAFEEGREQFIKTEALEHSDPLSDPLSIEERVAPLIEDEFEELEEPCSQAEDTDLRCFWEFISELETDYHRRDIFLAIAAYSYFSAADRPTFTDLWSWMERHLSAAPYQVSYYGTSIVVLFLSGALNHKGLVTNKNGSSEISKSSYKSNNYKEVRPIAMKIKAFLQENNIRNIPSIP